MVLKAQDNPPAVYPEGSLIEEMEGRWWVAHTKARNEKSLAWDLLKRGTSYFLPMVEKVQIISGRKVKSVLVLFAGYVFFCGSDDDRYEAMTTNRIAAAIEVPDQERLIKELSSIQRAMSGEKPLDPFPYLEAGQRGVVTSGPMKGVEGLLVRRKNVDRLVLEVHVLGQAVSTEIDASLLDVVE